MTAQIIDGKALAGKLKHKIRAIIHSKLAMGDRRPGLAVVLVGEDPASHIYVRNKRLACEEVGIHSVYHHLPTETTAQHLLELIKTLNQADDIDGILIQSPLPAHIDLEQLIEQIDPKKDVDGFHAYNLGRLAQRRPLLRPCTPFGVMLMLEHINQSYKGKHAVVIGASNSVGRPMALELLLAGCTVTICHRFTHSLSYFIKQADILIAAVGKPAFIKGEWIKEDATVIDIGISRQADGKIIGDVEFEAARAKAAWITPVPGGVGPMTVAVLLYNTLFAAGYLHLPLSPETAADFLIKTTDKP